MVKIRIIHGSLSVNSVSAKVSLSDIELLDPIHCPHEINLPALGTSTQTLRGDGSQRPSDHMILAADPHGARSLQLVELPKTQSSSFLPTDSQHACG